MKILLLSAAKSIHTVKWVNAFAARGHEVYLVYNKEHEPAENAIDSRVNLHCLKYGGAAAYYLNALELSRYVKDVKPDVINVHYASGYGTLARMARIHPVLLSVWGSDVYDFPYEGKIKKHILKRNVRYASGWASTSRCMAEQLRKVMEDCTLPVAITPFGVDLEQFSGGRENRRDNEIVLGNIKALEEKYGIRELIIVFSRLREKYLQSGGKKDLKLEIYGDGSQRRELESQINELGLQDCISLKGRIPNTEVPDVLRQLDIFCALSQLKSESFGVAVVEAMAMEKPVVVSDVDGFREVVEDCKTGYIVPKSNLEEAVERLWELIEDESLRESMGKSGRERVEKLYNWEKNVSTMLELYENMRQ